MNIDDKQNSKARQTVAVYNMLVNLFWSALSLTPLTVFCYTKLNLALFLLFLGVSMVPVFLPPSFISKLRFTNSAATYRKLGVLLVQRFSQNGRIVNRLVRKKHPGYKAVRWSKPSLNALVHQTYMFEKFHWVLFVFFGLTTFYALGKGLVGWTIFLLLANLFYNVYPIWLQQYIRVKLALYHNKHTASLSVSHKGAARWACLTTPPSSVAPRSESAP